MNVSHNVVEASPLIISFGSAIFSSLYSIKSKGQDFVLSVLGVLAIFFVALFFIPALNIENFHHSWFELGLDQVSLFVGAIFCISLFIGIFPVRKELVTQASFLYYVAGGLGIILSNNLLTFFLFWTFHRSLPFMRFLKGFREGNSGGGTYIFQHLFTFGCLITILIMAQAEGVMTVPFNDIPSEFFSLTILLLSFIVIYGSHGVFPLHSWVHDTVGNLKWFEISSIFLSRAGVLLFVKFLLPSFDQEPDTFRILLLSLTIFSSIYWSVRGILETNVTQITTYFYVAQSSLVLAGLQADAAAEKGAYLHLMVISLSGTALWSILSYIQHYVSIKRLNQFYGLAQFFPNLATLFCLFGFCMIGVPLGASFVAEDIVITGLVAKQPYLGLGHILATSLSGMLFFLVFSKLFLGQAKYQRPVLNRDMTMRQMIPYLIVVLVMFLLGICPFLFIEKLRW